ncbi:DUF4173 domain-containing protein [Planctomycetales bacterium ZRK34]|nr:DUF4173 domain-containing protein [Planctomycetales bacterium ZRK34]
MRHLGQSVAPTRTVIFLLLATLGLVALADFFFYDHLIGITAGLYTAALLVIVLARYPAALKSVPGVITTLALIGLIGAMIDWPGWLEIILTACALLMLVRIGQRRWQTDPFVWFGHWLRFIFTAWATPFHDYIILRRAARGSGLRTGRRAAGWGVPVLLTAVFVGLFAAANPIIEKWLNRFFDWVQTWPDHINVWRVVFWLISAIIVWALLRWRSFQKQRVNPNHRVPPRKQTAAHGPTLADAMVRPDFIVRCLVLFNFAFAVETVLDLIYLTGGADLPDGMTYKTYARRGAYPLVVTALLAGAFVLICFRSGAAGPAMKNARRLVYLFLIQNVMLLFSAAWRLYLYIDVSMITRLRVATIIWMAILTFAFVTVFIRIITERDNAWLARVNALFAAVVIYACCFVNFDAMITDFNVRHCKNLHDDGDSERFKIDIGYARHLGPESLPGLRWLREQVRDEDEFLTGRLDSAIQHLEIDLVAQHADWRGWTWRTARLMPAVTE